VVVVLWVVLDTNILVSAFFWDGKERELLIKCKNRDLTLIISIEILDELGNVLNNKFKVPDEMIQDYLKEILLFSELVFPPGRIDIIKEHSNDNIILETAVIGKANVLITGDKHLLKLKKYRNVKIRRTREI
jgi:putative PIN family toxin of toxin-antitoxin system